MAYSLTFSSLKKGGRLVAVSPGGRPTPRIDVGKPGDTLGSRARFDARVPSVPVSPKFFRVK
jgi:hypothetical protein